MATTVQVEEKTKKALERLKIHQNETYNELIERLIASYSKEDKASLVETVDVLSNPETMRSIARGIEDFEKGRMKSLSAIKLKMGL